MLDFPDIVMTKNSVYISTNIFNYNTGGSYKGAVTLRIPMDDIKQLKPLTYDIFTTAPQDAAGFNDPAKFGNGNLRGTRGLNQTTLYLGTQPDSANSSLPDLRMGRVLIQREPARRQHHPMGRGPARPVFRHRPGRT